MWSSCQYFNISTIKFKMDPKLLHIPSQNFTQLLYCSPLEINEFFLFVFESLKVALAEVMVVYVHTVSNEVLLSAS